MHILISFAFPVCSLAFLLYFYNFPTILYFV